MSNANDDKSPLIDLLTCIVCKVTMKIADTAPDAEGSDLILYRNVPQNRAGATVPPKSRCSGLRPSFAFHHVRNVLGSPGRKLGFSFANSCALFCNARAQNRSKSGQT